MGICTEFAPRSASWFKAAVLGLACLAAAAGQSVTVDSGPVLTESVANPTHSANCPVTAPPTVSAFHAGDPVMTIWLGLLGLTPQDSVQFDFSYNGAPEPTLGWNWAAGSFQSGYNYLLCPSLGSSSVLQGWGQAFTSLFPNGGGAGSWTLGVYIDGSSSPIDTIPFTILSGSGNANPVIASVATAYAGPVIAQNTFIVVKGTNLVPASTPASGAIWSTASSFAIGLLPTLLGGVSVTVDNQPAFVYFYCSAATDPACPQDQLNILTPLDTTVGQVPVVVASGAVSSPPFAANIQPFAPSFLLFSTAGDIAATHADYSLVGPTTLYPGLSTPAAPGEEIALYAVGFGLPATPLINGSSTQSGSLPVLPVCQVGGLPSTVAFAGLVGPGLYQLNLTIPLTAANGDNLVSCTYNGSTTPAGDQIAVQSSAPVPTLTITTSGTGNGTIGSFPAGTSCGLGCLSFPAGTVITLTATPNAGSTFAGWSGACSGTGSCTLTVTANSSSNTAVTATFNLAAPGGPSTLAVLPGQVIYGVIDQNGGAYSNLTPYLLVATGGNVLSGYTWSVPSGSPRNYPPAIAIQPFGVVDDASPASLTPGVFTMPVEVSEGTTAVTSQVTIDLSSVCNSSNGPSNNPCYSAGLTNQHIQYLPSGTVGKTYAATIVTSGGTPPYSWFLGAGSLPPGIVIDQARGILRGTPAIANTYHFYVLTTDAAGSNTWPEINDTVLAAQFTIVVH